MKLISQTIKSRWRYKLVLLYIFIGFHTHVSAQFPQEIKDYWKFLEGGNNFDPYIFQGVTVSPMGTESEALLEFLAQNIEELKDERVSIELAVFRKSIIGTHYQYYQTFMGTRIYGSEIKANLRDGRKVSTVIASLADTRTWPNDLVKKQEGLPDGEDEVVFFDGEVPQMAWVYEEENVAKNEFYEVIKLADGTVLKHDVALHRKDPVDTVAWVYVYNPDPLTTYERVYGGELQNFADEDTDSLTNARVLKSLELKYENDTFWLQNDHALLIGGQNFQRPYALTDTFDFLRSQDQFEYVNSIYHITEYKNYLSSIGGFDDLLDYQVRINARAFLDDNSSFKRTSNSGGRGVLYFGYSSTSLEHVDDAEDADVVIHELGHALSYSANENIPSGVSRESIDEGLGDYLACAYSKRISEYRWQYLFNWDGHNPFWEEGRSCFSDVTFDDYSRTNSIYTNGEILAVTLMEVYDKLGSEVADKIILSSLYEYANNMEFDMPGKLLLDAEKELYDGLHFTDLCTVLAKRKYVEEAVCGIGIAENRIETLRAEIPNEPFRKNGEIRVNFSAPFSGTLSLYTVDGREVLTRTIRNQQHWNQTISCEPGTYLVKLDNGQQYQVEKLVKN